MVSKLAAAVLTILGGVFYVAAGVLFAAVAPSAPSLLGDLSNVGTTGLTASSLEAIVYYVAAFNILSGALIIFGGFLLNSSIDGRRKAGGILAMMMMVLGGLTSLGGFIIGFILTLVGSIFGLTYKPEPRGADYEGPSAVAYSAAPQTDSVPDYTALPGRLNYCPKCGARLREGSVFCASCGVKVPE